MQIEILGVWISGFAAIVGSFAAIAAWKAATATQLSVNEMRNARLQYVRPRILLDTSSQIYFEISTHYQPEFNVMEKDSSKLGPLPYVSLTNIGTGPAFDITIEQTSNAGEFFNKMEIDNSKVSSINKMLEKFDHVVKIDEYGVGIQKNGPMAPRRSDGKIGWRNLRFELLQKKYTATINKIELNETKKFYIEDTLLFLNIFIHLYNNFDDIVDDSKYWFNDLKDMKIDFLIKFSSNAMESFEINASLKLQSYIFGIVENSRYHYLQDNDGPFFLSSLIPVMHVKA